MTTIRFYYGRDSNEIVRKLQDALADDKHVSSIEIRNTVLEEDVIDAVVNLVSKGYVETVHLYDCGAHLNKSAMQIARALGNCKQVLLTQSTFLTKYFLESLLVPATKLLSLRIQDHLLVEQLEALSKGLMNNKTLHSLDLSRSRVDDVSLLAEGLRNTCIRRLQLRSIGLQDHSAAILISSLRSCPTLESLDLSFNNLRCLSPIGKFLECPNCNLRDLRLGYQNLWQMHTIDVSEISKALTVNSRLRTLKLPRNELDDSSAMKLNDALFQNSTLENLDLRDNNMSDLGVTLLAKAAMLSNGLRRLLVGDNSFGTKASIALLEAVSRNYNLIQIDGNRNLEVEHINKQIRYQATLNRGGRKLLVEDALIALWPLVLDGSRYKMKKTNKQRVHSYADVAFGATDPETTSHDVGDLHADVLFYLTKEGSSTIFH